MSRNSPARTKSTHSTYVAGSGRSLPPPGSISTIDWENVVEYPAIGRDSTQARVRSQCGKQLVTMSRSTPRGMIVYASVMTARSVRSACCGGRPATGVK